MDTLKPDEKDIESADSLLGVVEEVDEKDLEGLFEKMEESEEAVAPPDTRLDARNWVMSYYKMEKEKKYLKDTYIKYLKERYIDPVKKEIDKLGEKQEMLKYGLKEFLDNIEEDRVSFPEIATVYRSKNPDKLIYPEDEDKLAKELQNKGSKFVEVKPRLDKREINKVYKETGKVPVEGLTAEEGKETVKLRKK